MTVHIGARISAHAGARKELVSTTTKDLVGGSGLRFEEQGVQSLKGMAGDWPLTRPTPNRPQFSRSASARVSANGIEPSARNLRVEKPVPNPISCIEVYGDNSVFARFSELHL